MRFASSIAVTSDAQEAVEQLLDPIDRSITPGMVDLVFLFITGHYEDDVEHILERTTETFPHAVMVGCSACGAIGVDREVEGSPAMSLVVGSLPNVRICPFALRQPELLAAQTVHDWERIVGVSPESDPTFIAMGDPFRLNILGFVDQINHAYAGAPLLGGVASAADKPEGNMLFLNGEVFREGVVGVALTGDVVVEGVVSQGCKPIGKHFVITKGQRNVIQELGGHPPLHQLETVLSGLSKDEKKLAKQSLLVGRVIDEYKGQFAGGDFLIHGIIGADRQSGAIAIAGHVRVGTTIQFQVRDAASADQNLRESLTPHADAITKGALLFACAGRGKRMYPDTGHDVGVFREIVGGVPLAGFFCGGEFGQVGGRNFVHGFSTSIAMFREKTA